MSENFDLNKRSSDGSNGCAEGGFLGGDKRGILGGQLGGKSGVLHGGIKGMFTRPVKLTLPIIIIILLLALIVAPISYLIISQTSDIIFSNMTEGTNLGARLTAAVLSMDFNQNGENYLNLPYQNRTLYEQGTYIKDGSVYNNFGTSSGLTKQYWWNGNTNGASVINGSLQFDGVNDYVSITGMVGKIPDNFTLSIWLKDRNLIVSNPQYPLTLSGTAGSGAGFIKGAGDTGTNRTCFRTWGCLGGIDGYICPDTVYSTDFHNFIITHIANYSTTYSNFSLSYDGVLKQSKLCNFTTSVITGFQVGGNTVGGWYYNGSADDFIVFGRALNATEISTIYNEGVAGRTVDMTFDYNDTRTIPADSRVGYWSFNTNESGNASEIWNGRVNLSCKTGYCPIWNTGGFVNTGMLTFNGSSFQERLNSTFNQETNLTGDRSWGAWIKPRDAVASTIIYRGPTGGGLSTSQYGLGLYTNYFCTMGNISGSNKFMNPSSAPIKIGVWTRIDCTFNASDNKLSMYYNGIFIANNSINVSNIYAGGDKPFTLGATENSYAFNGYLDEVMLFNKTLTASEITGLFQDGSKKLHLQLNELSGTTASGIGFNGTAGTLTGYPAINPTAPIYNATGGVNNSGAYVFDANDDFISIPVNTNAGSPVTLSTWVNLRGATGGTNAYPTFIGGSGAGSPMLRLYGSSRQIDFLCNPGNYIRTSWDIPLNQWILLTATHDVNTLNLYVNGLLNMTVNASTVCSASTGYNIGVRKDSTGYSVNGSIDNVQIFNRALSAQEVLALYNGTNANRTIKYSSKQGDFTSGVFYNSTTSTYWNVTLATADTTNRSGIVNPDNSINISHPNLVSYWALDGNYLDATRRNNGTGVANITNGLNNATGLTSSAIKFDGVDDYVNFGDNANLRVESGSFSISAWVNSNSVITQTQCFLFKANPNMGSNGYTLGINGTGIDLTKNGVANQFKSYTFQNNIWYHLLAVQPLNGNVTYYINGVSIGSYSNTASYQSSSGQSFYIGNKDTACPRKFNGTIDEILIYNSSLSASQVSQLYKSGLSQHASTNVTIQTRTANSYNTSDPSLVSFWSFNNDNSTTAFDELGRNNGTLGNATAGTQPVANDGNGTVGKGYYFDGSNDIIISQAGSLGAGSTPKYSVSLWYLSNSASTGKFLIEDRDATHWAYKYQIQYNSGPSITANACATDACSTAAVASASGISLGVWHHVAATFDNTNNIITLYIDGVNKSTSTSAFDSTQNNLLNIGGSRSPGGWAGYFNGSIDEVRIYNRSLSADEVLNLYQLGSYHIGDWSAWTSAQTCYDNETRIQTESGWKLFSELNRSEKVATLNPKTNKIEYKSPSEYQVYDAPEFMYKIITEKGEMIVSPDHKVYSATGGEKGYWKLVVGIIFILIGLIGLLKLLRDWKREDIEHE